MWPSQGLHLSPLQPLCAATRLADARGRGWGLTGLSVAVRGAGRLVERDALVPDHVGWSGARGGRPDPVAAVAHRRARHTFLSFSSARLI